MRVRVRHTQLAFTHDQDRVVSPVVVIAFAVPLYCLEVAVWQGQWTLAIRSIEGLGVLLAAARFFELALVERVDERVAVSRAIGRWTTFKRRLRIASKRRLPAARRLAIIYLATYLTVLLPAVGQASFGLPLPNVWTGGLVAPSVGYSLFYAQALLAFVAGCTLLVGLVLDAVWVDGDETELRTSPIVYSREVAVLLRKEPVVAAIPPLLLCCLIGEFLVS